MTRSQYAIKTEVGTLYLVASEKGLQSILFDKQEVPLVKKLILNNKVHSNLHTATTQLKEYFSGLRKNFDLKLDLVGTEFQQKVWKQLVKIPFGKTLSYKDVAQKINNSKAVRAVGTANGKNPLCIVIPCHRVIAADGTMGGYTAGLKIKKKLLNLESVSVLVR